MKSCKVFQCQRNVVLKRGPGPSKAHFIKTPQSGQEEAGGYRGHFFPTSSAEHCLCRHHFNKEPEELKKLLGSVDDTVFKDLYLALKYANFRGGSRIFLNHKYNVLVVSQLEKVKNLEPLIQCLGIGKPPEALSLLGKEMLLKL